MNNNEYEITFRLNGRVYKEVAQGNNPAKIRELLRARYPEAVITSVRQR